MSHDLEDQSEDVVGEVVLGVLPRVILMGRNLEGVVVTAVQLVFHVLIIPRPQRNASTNSKEISPVTHCMTGT